MFHATHLPTESYIAFDEAFGGGWLGAQATGATGKAPLPKNDLNLTPPYAPGGGYQSFAELVGLMDKMIGRVVAALDDFGLRDNTLIIFASDNGIPVDHIIDAMPGKRLTYTKVPIISG